VRGTARSKGEGLNNSRQQKNAHRLHRRFSREPGEKTRKKSFARFRVFRGHPAEIRRAKLELRIPLFTMNEL